MPVTVLHVFTNNIADGTNSSIVRPSDWNSTHANTLSIVATEIVGLFSNANGVSFGTSGTGITASIAGGGGSGAAISAGTNSQNTGTVKFSNSNGVTFGLNTNGVMTGSVATNYQSQGAYLTTARASNDGIGTNTALTANGVSATANSLGLSLNFPAFLTTAMASNRGTDFVQAAAVFAGTNASGTIASGGISVSVAAPAAGIAAGVSNLGNTAGSTGTVSTGNVVFVGSNGISLSQSTGAAGSAATITISGDGVTLSTFQPAQAIGFSTASYVIMPTTSGVVSIFPFSIPQYVSAGVMNVLGTANFTTVGTSSGLQTAGIAVGLYTRNVSTLSSVASASFSWQVSGNNSSYTINQVTQTAYSGYGATAATNSAGVNITSGYTGVKMFGFPINQLLTPGQYWLAFVATNSTSSNNVGMTVGFFGAVMNTALSAGAPIGSFSSAYTSGQDPFGGRFFVGNGNWSSAGSVTNVPVSMNFASISAAAGASAFPLINFWST